MRKIVKKPNLLYWMRSYDGIVAVRVVGQDEESRVLKVNQKSKRPFAEMRRTIEALDPRVVELLDKQGAVLGAVTLGPSEEELEEEAEEEAEAEATAASERASEMKLFAQLIADAYKHSTNVAFDKFVEVFRTQTDAATSRQVSLEKSLSSLERTLSRQAREMARAAESADPPAEDESLVNTLIGSMMAGQQAKAAAASGGNGTSKVASAAVAAAAKEVAKQAEAAAEDDDEPEGEE